MLFFQNITKFFGMVRAVERGDNVTVTGIDGQIMTNLLAHIFETKAINKAMFTSITSTSLTFDRFFVPDLIYMLSKLVATDGVRWGTKRTCEKIISELLEKTWFKVSTQEHKPMVDIKKMRELKWKPLPHQTEFLELYGERMPKYDLRGILLGAAPGTGKFQDLNSFVKTPSGWVRMGDIKLNQQVSMPDGTSAPVIGIYPQGKQNIYTVHFEDGRSAKCGDDHLWMVYSKDWLRNGGNGWKILDLRTIKQYLSMSAYRDRLYIPLISPENKDDVKLPIDPYTLGVFLGDGSSSYKSVSICKPDDWLRQEVGRLLPDGLEVTEYRACGKTFHIKGRTIDTNLRMCDLIDSLGLEGRVSHTKFIPQIYMEASPRQKWDLIQGLMDTDGTVGLSKGRNGTVEVAGKGSNIQFCTTSHEMAKQIQYLIRSLGGLCKIKDKTPFYTYKGERKQGRDAYILHIRVKEPKNLFRMPRKRDRVSDSYQYTDSLKLRIREIEFHSVSEAQCIEVDHPDHLYITDHYVVTHNTFTDFMVATCVIPPEIAEVKIIISPKKAIHLVWEKSILQVFRKIPTYWVSGSTKVMPLRSTEYYIFNFEQLDKAIELGKALKARGVRYFVIVDESHNFADFRSDRTQKLVKLQTIRPDIYFVWASGSPVLKSAAELVSFLKCSDPRFSAQAERQFKKIYAASPGRANEIFNHRLGIMMAFLVPKSVVSPTKPKVIEKPIRLPPHIANKFLMSSVREEMKSFIVERLKFYDGQMKTLKVTVNTWLDYHEAKLTSRSEKKAFEQYVKDIKVISHNPDLMIAEVLTRARTYERTKLLPSLPPTERKGFKSALSAIKNIKLKVRGEALGTVLSKRRSECAAALAVYCQPEEIMKESLSKTLFFASSVLPIKTLHDHLEKMGFSPLMVYGGTNSELVSIMNRFEDDPSINPVCATMQSLSEAVPVTAASTVVLLNRPFRQGTWDQVVARADRLSQRFQVTVIETTLDTGGEPNVSSTTDAILTNVREMISGLIGPEFGGPDPDEREYKLLIDHSKIIPELDDIDTLVSS